MYMVQEFLLAGRQWGITETIKTYGTFNFPITANALALFTNDLVTTSVTKQDIARVVTFNTPGLTKAQATYCVNTDLIGSFYWFGIFTD